MVAAPAVDAGTAPAAALMECGVGPGRAPWNPYDEPQELRGIDGAFTDHCDATGNLVSYQCEAPEVPCARDPDEGQHVKRPPSPCWERTGRVVADVVDCDGQCRAGACNQRCPQFGDRLTMVSVDPVGNPVFANAADPRRFACALQFDQARDAYDCRSARAGDPFVVEGLGLSTSMCTGGTWGAVSDRRCTYGKCRFVYDRP